MTKPTYAFRTCINVGIAVIWTVLIVALPASGQVSTTNQYGTTGIPGNPLTELQRRLSANANSTNTMPLEGAVDPDVYVVGPGDQFLVSASMSLLSPGPIPVGADGRLFVPDAGPIDISGLTLRAALDAIKTGMSDTYGAAEVDVVLVSPRHFWVHVSGAVPTPGRYLTLPVARVSTVLEDAFADTTRTATVNGHLKPSLRNVTVIHQDGSEALVDLPRYFASGDLDADPYLRDGDVIFVPAYDPAFSSVYIDGAVPFPGPYDYRSDDTIKKLIDVAGGVDANSAVDEVRVLRSSGQGDDEIFTFSLKEILFLDKGSFHLEARDHVSLSRKEMILGSASVNGMVTNPGTYPITDGVTTLSELIEMSGGLQVDALLRAAFLERRSIPKSPFQNRRESVFTPSANATPFLLADSTEILRRIRLTDMDFLSRAYFAQTTRMQNRVSINLEAYVRGDAAPVTIRDGDRLVIPRDDKTVYVSGQVVRPGFVHYVDGMDADFYISQAGGRGNGAAETAPYIIQPGTGSVTRTSTVVIESGDMIFLDRVRGIVDDPDLERLVLEQQRAKSDARIRTMGVVLQTVATVASVTALIISLKR